MCDLVDGVSTRFDLSYQIFFNVSFIPVLVPGGNSFLFVCRQNGQNPGLNGQNFSRQNGQNHHRCFALLGIVGHRAKLVYVNLVHRLPDVVRSVQHAMQIRSLFRDDKPERRSLSILVAH